MIKRERSLEQIRKDCKRAEKVIKAVVGCACEEDLVCFPVVKNFVISEFIFSVSERALKIKVPAVDRIRVSTWNVSRGQLWGHFPLLLKERPADSIYVSSETRKILKILMVEEDPFSYQEERVSSSFESVWKNLKKVPLQPGFRYLKWQGESIERVVLSDLPSEVALDCEVMGETMKQHLREDVAFHRGRLLIANKGGEYAAGFLEESPMGHPNF